MHKLTNMEAQRVISVLEEAIDHMALISLVPTTPDAAFLKQIQEPRLRDAIQQQWQIEESLKITFNRRQTTNQQEGFDKAVLQMGRSTRIVCRQLRKYGPLGPLVSENGNSNYLNDCRQHFSDLTAVVFRRLSTTVEEESASNRMLRELTERERQASDDAMVLKGKLQAQRAGREKEALSHDQTLAKLQTELRDLRESNRTKMESIHAQMENQIHKSEKEHMAVSEQLIQKMNVLKDTLQTQRQADRDAEATLRKKKERIESDLAAQVLKYDKDVTDMQRQTEETKLKMTEEKDRLHDLEDYFNKIDANLKYHSLELKILSALCERKNVAIASLGQASSNLQKIARPELGILL